MKTFRMIGTALMALTLTFGMSACYDDVDFDPYADEPAVIEGRKDIMDGKLLFRLDANNLDQYHIPVSTLRNLDFEYQSDYYEFKQEVVNGTRYIIPVAKAEQPDYAHIVKLKASLKDEPERTRVVFLVFYKDDVNTRSLSGLDSEYSSVLGKGTNSFGKLGNTTQSVLLYDAIKHLSETHISANPSYSEKFISLNCQDKEETFTNWSLDVGVDVQKTFRKKYIDTLSTFGGMVSTKEKQKIKAKLNISADLGIDQSVKEAKDYEFSLNIAKAHCYEIDMNMSRYQSDGNNNEIDTTLITLVNPDFLEQLKVDSTKFDAVKFLDTWGTDVITRGAFGASWVYIYGRKQNIYETSQNYDAHVGVSVTHPQNVEIQKMAQVFAMKIAGIDGTQVDAKYSYMKENYQETTKSLTAKLTYGGHLGKSDWSEFTNGIEQNSALWTLMSYKLSSDTETEAEKDEGHKIYPIEDLAFNLLDMLIIRHSKKEASGDQLKLLKNYIANVNAISEAKPDYIDKNSLVVEKRSDMFLVDVMMKTGKNGKQKGEPKPFCAKDYRGEWRMYYPMMANAYSPVKGDIYYALETSQDEYNVAIDRSDHYWYYALASERDCNYGLVDIDFVHEKDIPTGYFKRGECARTDIGLSVAKHYVVVKPLDEGDSTAVANKKNTRLTSFGIQDADTKKIIASTGGSELRANAYQSEITEFEKFWTVNASSTIEKDSIKLHDGKDHYFYKGGGIHYHQLQPVISRKKLHINRGTTDQVWHPKRWGE